ncbi:pantoate--beta-alanine ligase [Akkermansiaceae bacterium]|nr:pantoate--beta-alanine ligase [Akkermansiaceae bacterium]
MKSTDCIPVLTDHLSRLPRPHVLVPTMGALHEGHIALITQARKLAGEGGTVIVSIFVNPTQFDKKEDLANYPKTLDSDLEKCKVYGVDLVFTPSPENMYFSGHSISVTEDSLTTQLCGATRPGHFDGVCTVVLKLFNITQSDIAIFGKKDYQQLAIIRRMVRDLNIPISIEGLETVREPSGLALSSRNTNLSSEQHIDAPRIRRALRLALEAYNSGERSVKALSLLAQREIEGSTEEVKIDYLEILDAESLQKLEIINQPAVMATAVFYGKVRLIDNIEIG